MPSCAYGKTTNNIAAGTNYIVSNKWTFVKCDTEAKLLKDSFIHHSCFHIGHLIISLLKVYIIHSVSQCNCPLSVYYQSRRTDRARYLKITHVSTLMTMAIAIGCLLLDHVQLLWVTCHPSPYYLTHEIYQCILCPIVGMYTARVKSTKW